MPGVLIVGITAPVGLTGVEDGSIVTAALVASTVDCVPPPAMLQPAANTRQMNRIRINLFLATMRIIPFLGLMKFNPDSDQTIVPVIPFSQPK
jgi:hypothetical protein